MVSIHLLLLILHPGIVKSPISIPSEVRRVGQNLFFISVIRFISFKGLPWQFQAPKAMAESGGVKRQVDKLPKLPTNAVGAYPTSILSDILPSLNKMQSEATLYICNRTSSIINNDFKAPMFFNDKPGFSVDLAGNDATSARQILILQTPFHFIGILEQWPIWPISSSTLMSILSKPKSIRLHFHKQFKCPGFRHSYGEVLLNNLVDSLLARFLPTPRVICRRPGRFHFKQHGVNPLAFTHLASR